MMSVAVRKFERKDQQEVRDLVLEGLAERWGSVFDPSYNRDLDDISNYYVERHRATIAVLEDSDQPYGGRSILGCGILLPLPAEDVYDTWCPEPESRADVLSGLRICRMMRLSVSKDCRGKGYAKRIIHHLVEVAREQGFDRILVETETLWTSAVQIYKSMGFEVVESGEENIHFEYVL